MSDSTSMFEMTLADGMVPILAFDTETSGTDPKSDHIITWGTSSIDDPEFEGVMQLPEHVTELDEGNVAVHGYTIEMIAEQGMDRIEGLRSMFDTLNDFNDTTRGFIVGHNVVYDMTILAAELAREGMTEQAEKVEKWRVLDTYPLLEATELIGMFNMVLKLFPVAELLGVDEAILKNAHNAGADSRVAAALLERMTMYFPSLVYRTRDDLNRYMHDTAIKAQYRKLAIFEEGGIGYPVTHDKSDGDSTRAAAQTERSTKKRTTGRPTKKSADQKSESAKKSPRSRSERTGNSVTTSGRTARTVRSRGTSRLARTDK